MKFLVYGANGWIGSYIANILTNAGDTVVVGQRIICVRDVKDDLEKHQPDRVVCSVGRTYGPGNSTIDYLEGPGKLIENLRANLTAPILIAQATRINAIPMLYIGSGCIFEYDEKHKQGGAGFTEESIPNFFGSAYSIVKGQTDILIRGYQHVLCARIRMPITDANHPREFITKIVGYKKICSIPNSMTCLSDWLPFLIGCLVEKKAGVINAVNPGAIEHKTILSMYQTVFGVTHQYELMSEEEQNRLLLARRSNNYLETGKAETWIAEMSSEVKVKYGVPVAFLPIDQKIEEILRSRALKEKNNLAADSEVKVMLVTGGAGFIGSNFINFWMHSFPQDIIVNFDCLEAHSNLKNIENPNAPNYTFVQGNLVDKQCLKELFQKYSFTHVVHFAAASNVDVSFVDPLNCTLSNVLGTHRLLETVRDCTTLKLFLFISTDEVYGEVPVGEAPEDSVFFPTNPYAATKAAAECLVMSYGKSFHIPWIITRANNVYGRYQYPAQAIPKFLTCLLNREKMPVHGNGLMSRKFVHTTDKCRALRTLIERGTLGEVYNIGTSDEVTVLELCGKLLKNVLGPVENLADWTRHIPDRCYNDCRYSVDSTKLQKLGWQPEIRFEDGLKDTVQWYTNNRDHWIVNSKSNSKLIDEEKAAKDLDDAQNSGTFLKIKNILDEIDEIPSIVAQVKYA